MPSLMRTRDGAGDSGAMSTIMRLTEPGEQIEYKHNARPTVGWAIRVGCLGSRSFAMQDYWTTTPVTEILEDTGDMVRFRTGNSEYIWRA